MAGTPQARMRYGMPLTPPQMPQVAPAPAPPDIEALLSMLPPEQQQAFRAQYAQYAPPEAPNFAPINTQPQGALEGMAQSLGPRPFNMPQGYMRGGAGGAFLTGLASGFGNALTSRGASSYNARVNNQASDQLAQKAAYEAGAAENRGARNSMIGQLTSMAGRGDLRKDEFLTPDKIDHLFVKGLVDSGVIPKASGDLAIRKGIKAKVYDEWQNKGQPAARGNGSVTGTTISPRAERIGRAIMRGEQRPNTISKLPSRDPDRSGIVDFLASHGVDTNRIEMEIGAETKYWGTQNDSKRTSQKVLLGTLLHTIPYTRKLVEQAKAAIPGFSVAGFNKVQLAAAQNLPGNAGRLARRLYSQVADIGGEVGGLYMGGNANTSESFQLAKKNISGDWSHEQLLDALDQIEVNANFRKNAIDDVKASGPGYPSSVPGGGGIKQSDGGTSPVQKWGRDASGNPVPLGG